MEPNANESDPFAAIHTNPEDRVPRARTSAELLGGILGFLIMGPGGIVIAALLGERLDTWSNMINASEITVGIGFAICAAGFALFN